MSALSEHRPWCDSGVCITDDNDELGTQMHFGHLLAPVIDAIGDDWRAEPMGEPEIQIRRIEFDGHAGVELDLGSIRVRTTSGSIGCSWLSPSEAKQVAWLLLAAAEQIA